MNAEIDAADPYRPAGEPAGYNPNAPLPPGASVPPGMPPPPGVHSIYQIGLVFTASWTIALGAAAFQAARYAAQERTRRRLDSEEHEAAGATTAGESRAVRAVPHDS